MTDAEFKIQEAFHVLSQETKGLLFISTKRGLLTSSSNITQLHALQFLFIKTKKMLF